MNTASFCIVIQRPVSKRFRLDGQVLEHQVFPETQLQNFNETISYAICKTSRNLNGRQLMAFRQGFLEGCDRFALPVAMTEEPLFSIYGSNEREMKPFLWDVYDVESPPRWTAPLQHSAAAEVNQAVEDFCGQPESLQAEERVHEAMRYFGPYCSRRMLERLEELFEVSDNGSGGFTLTPHKPKGSVF